MRKSGLLPSTRVDEAEWLRSRLRSFGSGVASIVPDQFPAYVRVLHPAHESGGKALRWADVAARSGGTMHRLVQFHAIARPPSSGSGNDSASSISPPENGNLPPHLLSALCGLLAGHTSTPDSCWFCLWDGYGWLHGSPAVSVIAFTPRGGTSNTADPQEVPPDLPREVLEGPKVKLPQRNYFLFNGALDAATELGWTTPWGSFDPQSPNLFWPQDHAWCVASEIDLFCTLIAGSDVLAETLLADSRFEAWRVFPSDPVAWDSDRING